MSLLRRSFVFISSALCIAASSFIAAFFCSILVIKLVSDFFPLIKSKTFSCCSFINNKYISSPVSALSVPYSSRIPKSRILIGWHSSSFLYAISVKILFVGKLSKYNSSGNLFSGVNLGNLCKGPLNEFKTISNIVFS